MCEELLPSGRRVGRMPGMRMLAMGRPRGFSRNAKKKRKKIILVW